MKSNRHSDPPFSHLDAGIPLSLSDPCKPALRVAGHGFVAHLAIHLALKEDKVQDICWSANTMLRGSPLISYAGTFAAFCN